MDGFDQVLMYRDENYRFCAPKLSPVKTEIIAFEYKTYRLERNVRNRGSCCWKV